MLYFVVEGMPLGWTWALFFWQSALAAAVRTVVRAGPDGRGGLVEDGEAAPVLAPGWPIAAVYVDNALIDRAPERAVPSRSRPAKSVGLHTGALTVAPATTVLLWCYC